MTCHLWGTSGHHWITHTNRRRCGLFLCHDLIVRLVHYCSLQWRHNRRESVSNHQPHDCLLKRLFRRRSKKTSKLRVTGLCAGQMASNAENVSIWWRHHGSRGRNWAVVDYTGKYNSRLGILVVPYNYIDVLMCFSWKLFIFVIH